MTENNANMTENPGPGHSGSMDNTTSGMGNANNARGRLFTCKKK